MPQSHTTDQPMVPRGRVKKASSSLFPSENIAKLERTQSTVKQNKDLTLNPTNNGSNNKQWINNSRTTALERTAAEATGS